MGENGDQILFIEKMTQTIDNYPPLYQ